MCKWSPLQHILLIINIFYIYIYSRIITKWIYPCNVFLHLQKICLCHLWLMFCAPGSYINFANCLIFKMTKDIAIESMWFVYAVQGLLRCMSRFMLCKKSTDNNVKRFKDPLSSGNIQLESQSHFISLDGVCIFISVVMYLYGVLNCTYWFLFQLHCCSSHYAVPEMNNCLFFNTAAFF